MRLEGTTIPREQEQSDKQGLTPPNDLSRGNNPWRQTDRSQDADVGRHSAIHPRLIESAIDDFVDAKKRELIVNFSVHVMRR